MVSLDEAHANEARLLEYLTSKGIAFRKISHPVVLTVEQQSLHVTDGDGALAKNLLLKDKKGRLILVSALSATPIDLKLLSQRLGLGKGGLRMAPLEHLQTALKVPEGCVTPFALYNDTARSLPLLLDKAFQSRSSLLFHPLTNDSTIALARDSFEFFLQSIGREPAYVDFEAVVAVGKDQPPDLAHLIASGEAVQSEPGVPTAASNGTSNPAISSNVVEAAQAAEGARKPITGSKPAATPKGPPGDDVPTCAESIIAVLSRIQPPQNAASDAAPALSPSDTALVDELSHILVMFKNAAYTQGFVAGKSAVGARGA